MLFQFVSSKEMIWRALALDYLSASFEETRPRFWFETFL